MHATAQSSFSLPPHVPLMPGPRSSSLNRARDVKRLFRAASGSSAGAEGLNALSSAVTNSEEMRNELPNRALSSSMMPACLLSERP